jgi:deoxyhypusine synthase
VNETAVKSGIQYMMELTEWYKATSEPIGFLQLGGGIAGDFPICVVPMIRQDMGEEVQLWSWFGQISESTASYGGYSGAPPNEKISWGKLAPGTPMHVIESDATIVAPILFTYLLE